MKTSHTIRLLADIRGKKISRQQACANPGDRDAYVSLSPNGIPAACRSGDAELRLKKGNDQLFITRSPINTRGCLAVIEF